MKKSISKTVCIALLAVGIALFSFSACTDANAQTGRVAQSERWEYKMLELSVWDVDVATYSCRTTGERRSVEATLNSLGAEGWQLISVARVQHASPWFTFKRRLP